MPTYVIFAQTDDNPVYIDHINAASVAAAQTAITNALAKGIGVNGLGKAGPVAVAIVLADAAFVVTPPP